MLRGEIPEEELHAIDPRAFKPTSLTYDETWVGEKTEDVVKGVLRHEIGHANNTDYLLMIKGQRMARNDGYLPTSYMSAWNAIEDLWVNNREMRDSDLVRRQMTELYRDYLPKVIEELKSGKSTLVRQFGMRATLQWAKDEFGIVDQATLDMLDNGVLDARAVQAFQNIRDSYRKFIDPRSSASENFRTMSSEIWPIVKGLELEELTDEMIK